MNLLQEKELHLLPLLEIRLQATQIYHLYAGQLIGYWFGMTSREGEIVKWRTWKVLKS